MMIPRRRISQGVALSVFLAPALWLLPTPAWVFPRQPSLIDQLLARRIAALMAASRELSNLGKHRRWLAVRPSITELLNELFATTDLTRVLAWSDAELERALREATRRDYAQGRIDNVGGWLLAATEARVCALVAALD
jgi:hypothetical protein